MASSTFDDLVESGCDALRRLCLEHGENMMDESAEASMCKYLVFFWAEWLLMVAYLAVGFSESEPAVLVTR
jgi:hypothetical protein